MILAHFTGGDAASTLFIGGAVALVSGLRKRRYRRAVVGGAAAVAGMVAGFLHSS